MKAGMEEYFSKYSDEVRTIVESVQAESQKEGKVSYESGCRLMETAIEQDSDILIGIAYYHLAETCPDAGDKESSKINLLGCINYLQGKGPYEYIAKAYHLLGEIERTQDNPIMAMEYYESGILVCGENGFWDLNVILLIGIGDCYYQMEQTEMALNYYNRCIRQFKKMKKSVPSQEDEVRALIKRAKCLLRLKRMEEAHADKEKLDKILLGMEEERRPYAEINLFLAAFYQCSGEYENTVKYLERAGNDVEDNYSAGKQYCIREYFDILVQMNNYDRLAGAIKRLKQQTEGGRDKNFRLYILRMQIRYTSERMQEEELRSCVNEFFGSYDVNVKEKGESVMKNLEVRRQLRQIQEKQHELKVLNQKLLSSSLHDALTGLPNRGYLNEHSEKIFERARNKGYCCGICLIDIDYFKQLNDRYGHMAGDKCLTAVGNILIGMRNSRIFCARYGGDEFTLVLHRMKKDEIERLLEELKNKIEEMAIPNEDAKIGNVVTMSVGCFNAVPEKEDKLWDFFSRADAALYQAKYMGRNRYMVLGKLENDMINEGK